MALYQEIESKKYFKNFTNWVAAFLAAAWAETLKIFPTKAIQDNCLL